MDKKLIDRINQLSRKSKAEGLSPEEKAEQQDLKKEYLTDFRGILKRRWENVKICLFFS